MTTEQREAVRRWPARLTSSVRGRATVITVGVSAVILLLLFTLLLLLVRDFTLNKDRRTSERTVERVVDDLRPGDPDQMIVPRPGEAPWVQVVTPEGEVVAASSEVRGHPSLAGTDVRRGKLPIDGRYCPESLGDCAWVFGLRLRDSPWGPGAVVMAGTPLPGKPTMAGLAASALLVLAGLLFLIGWWTWYTIGRVFVPVDQIRAQMADFSAHGLGHRIPLSETSGELRSLAETVNSTLDKLEDARVRERRFVSDASHDLRNPLSGLQMQLELALEEPPDSAGWKPMVRSALGDTRRLNDILVDLLALSKLDSRAPAEVETVDLAALARREIGRREPRVTIETRLEPGVTVRANRVRLARVLSNLLSNAERHAESRIEVIVLRDGDDAVLEVLDDGSGVPEDARERVFERFSRLPESRARDPQGTGLGLPIAREIAEIYGGSLRIADSPRGARFVMRLPLAPGSPER